MTPSVHLRPDRLRLHAREAADLAETLQAALAARPPDAELDHLATVLRRAVGELVELGDALVEAAAAGEVADREAADGIRRAGRDA
jgi:hypothetical protein